MASTGRKMNQIPAPAGRLWEASIRKLTTIRSGAAAFPAAVAGVDGLVDPATGTISVASSSADDTDGPAAADADEANAAEDDAELGEPSHSEQLLPSGEFYQGDLRGDLPHGQGKFLWTDGSMYEGAWARGRAAGRGKFSWPSGATYAGDRKSGVKAKRVG
jgi:1-phosphatidylinositol-4-phosphate 5-kinase